MANEVPSLESSLRESSEMSAVAIDGIGNQHLIVEIKDLGVMAIRVPIPTWCFRIDNNKVTFGSVFTDVGRSILDASIHCESVNIKDQATDVIVHASLRYSEKIMDVITIKSNRTIRRWLWVRNASGGSANDSRAEKQHRANNENKS